jgi:hypothetical protein
MTRRALLFFSVGLALVLALGWLGFPRLLYARAEQPLGFSHEIHASDKTGLGCADCHPTGEDGRFAGIPRIDNCAGCHAEAQGETAEEKRLVEEYVVPGREIPWLVYARQPENVRFPHAIHVKRGGFACERCHGAHGTSAALPPHETNRITGYSRDVRKMSDCESCHADNHRERTSCLACHK